MDNEDLIKYIAKVYKIDPTDTKSRADLFDAICRDKNLADVHEQMKKAGEDFEDQSRAIVKELKKQLNKKMIESTAFRLALMDLLIGNKTSATQKRKNAQIASNSHVTVSGCGKKLCIDEEAILEQLNKTSNNATQH